MSSYSRDAPPSALIDLALTALARHFAGERFEPKALAPPWAGPAPVFVTLRGPDGKLRGCIGRTAALCATLAAEVADCALGAATRDPRMRPLEASELPTLQVEISILGPLQPIAGPHELDPLRYGVAVKQGARRGVLLPGIEGVENAAHQLRLVLAKAGIDPHVPYELERFIVDKVTRRR